MSTRAVGQNLGNSIHIRGDIDVTNLVCVPCKKKHGGAATCYAHAIVDGKGICVFCEDGEPCMHEQRQAKAAKNLQIVKTNLTPGSGTVPREAHNLETSGSTPVRATSSKVAAPPQQPSVLNPRSPWRKFGSLALPSKEKSMQTALAKTNGHAPAMPEFKVCGRSGCGKQLRPSNESGFCSKHFYDSKRSESAKAKAETKSAHRGTKPAKRETAPRRRPAQEKLDRYVAQHTPTLQLQVSESQLDRFLGTVDWNGVVSKLPADMKLTLANHYFAAGLDQVEVKAQAAAA